MEDSGWWPVQSSPVECISSSPGAGREEDLASGLSLRASRIESSRAEFESTTARGWHRYLCPVRGKASVHCAQQVTRELPAGGEPAGFIQYSEGGPVPDTAGGWTLQEGGHNAGDALHRHRDGLRRNLDAKM